MTQGNVEVVRGMYEAFHGGDAQRALDHFHPDVVLDSTRRVDGGIGRGREELAVTIGRWIGAFDDWHETIEEIRAVGEHVYVVLTQRGRGKGSGIDRGSLRDSHRDAGGANHPPDPLPGSRGRPGAGGGAGYSELILGPSA
jgi:hypothetical protein